MLPCIASRVCPVPLFAPSDLYSTAPYSEAVPDSSIAAIPRSEDDTHILLIDQKCGQEDDGGICRECFWSDDEEMVEMRIRKRCRCTVGEEKEQREGEVEGE